MKWTILDSVSMLRTAAVADDLELALFHKDGVACYDVISACDLSNATTLTTLGIKRGTSEFLITTYTAPAAGVVTPTLTRIFAPADARPFARFTGGSPGDRLMLYVFGYISDANNP
jgi:hypothetical protein